MFSTPADRRHAIWLSDPSFAAAEIARGLGYGAAILDIEHGSFDLADLERFIPFFAAWKWRFSRKYWDPSADPFSRLSTSAPLPLSFRTSKMLPMQRKSLRSPNSTARRP